MALASFGDTTRDFGLHARIDHIAIGSVKILVEGHGRGERPSQGAENYRKAAKKIKIIIGRVGKYYRKANFIIIIIIPYIIYYCFLMTHHMSSLIRLLSPVVTKFVDGL